MSTYQHLRNGAWRGLLRRRPGPAPAVAPGSAGMKAMRLLPAFPPLPGQLELVQEVLEACRAMGLSLRPDLRVTLKALGPDDDVAAFGFGEHVRAKDGQSEIFVLGFIPPEHFVKVLLHEIRHVADVFPGAFGGEAREQRAESFVRGLEW